MIKAKDLIKTKYICTVSDDAFDEVAPACIRLASTLYKQNLFAATNANEVQEVHKRYMKLAERFERDFLRETKRSKYIILYGCTELVNMEIFAWNTSSDVPYHENAVFDNKKEAKQVAESEQLQNYIVVEVKDEN